jgi:nitroimidazol reductase NimA-like FMN-containing flavoprotein (pyridoxamine 5'-phosphate oxidase superfamily)
MPIEWLSQEKCRKMLGPQVYGRLATTGKDSRPWIAPVNYVYDNDAIYIHTGLKGRKLDNIAVNPSVCFEISSPGNLYISERACGFSMRYWSIIVEGRAELVSDINEKRQAMNSLMDKYAGRYEYTDPSDDDMGKINVIKINIESISGKFNVDPQE